MNRRGFTILELLIAGSIFLLGVVGITTMIIYSSQLASVATARDNMTRLASRVHQDMVQRGYDGVTDGVTNITNLTDPQGRAITITVTVASTTSAVTGCNSLLTANPLPPVQTCCGPGNVCCRLVTTSSQWREVVGGNLALTAPLQMQSFVTKGCP